MGIRSFLKAQKGDPDWAFTPDQYFEKEFKVIDANLIELKKDRVDSIILRQTPTEKDLLAKHLHIDVRENATLDLAIINEASNKLQQVFIYDIRVREGAHINFGLFVTGGKLNKHIIQVVLDSGATFNGYGHLQNNVGGDCEIITKIDHQGSFSTSNQFFSCEAGKDSQTVLQVMVNVPREIISGQVGVSVENLITGKNGNCHSLSDVINLSDSTKVNTGSDTDILDQERLYYLQTRGISQSSGESFLIRSHRNQVLELIQDNEIKEEIRQLLLS